MKEVEKYACPNIDCNWVGFEGGECPECGNQLIKPKGDDYQYSTESDDDREPVANLSDLDDDPDSVTWYSDGEEQYGVM